jgi:error-prone DNA polymerase
MSFVHLNVHSHYSRGWGLAGLEELCCLAREQGLDRLALTDTNGLYGLIPFLQAARDYGLKAIVGSEIKTADQRAVALVRDPTGYANLCRLLSDRHCRQDFDLVAALKERRQGLIIFSDDFSLLKALKRESNEDLFVELSPGYNSARAYAFSRESGIPPLASNRVYLARPEQFELHRILRAVDLNSKLSRLETRDLCRPHNFLNSSQAMVDQFPHAPQAVRNTLEVAERCLTDWDFSRLIFPAYERLNDQEAYERLYQATLQGCLRRYGAITPVVQQRVAHEMRIIRAKNFSHYFLVVADITSQTGRTCGRGSAAASIVAYSLGITQVDPIQHNLFFERFLNLGRQDPPDIDVDFAWDEREQIIDYVFSKYGPRRAAMVANHNTFGARSAVREVAKVFGLTEQEISRVTQRIGFSWRLKESWQEWAEHPKMRGITFEKPWDEILQAAAQLEDHLNHLSVHCGGLVIVPDEVRRYCPVEISANGLQVLQWEKEAVEEAGLVKIDLLGNRSLAVIRDALALVEQNTGRRFEQGNWSPIQDKQAIEKFYEGDTFGVFYFESPATRQTLKKVRACFSFEEYRSRDHFLLNVVVTSIIRPASNQSIHTWVSRLKGEPWQAPHPLLEPVLAETLGVMVFQEQLSQAAIHLAGFEPGEADTLRKVVTKKHREKKLRDFHERFAQGAAARGVSAEVIEEVWQMMMGFDGYSFCKPHSASYTLVAYQSAYLRAHYPAEFMAAVISNGGGYYSTFGYISEARRMGLRVLGPDINLSALKYTGREREIRVGLMQVQTLSREAKKAILNERSRYGPFKSLDDFLQRVGSRLHLEDARILIKAGCFDAVSGGLDRPALLWRALAFFEQAREPKQISLWTKAGLSAAGPQRSDPKAAATASYSEEVRLRHELDSLGLLLSVHPLDRFAAVLKKIAYVRARDLERWKGKRVTMIGWLVTAKTVQTKEGDPMKFVSFEDPTGIYEAVFFPKAYHQYCHLLSGARPYLLKGKVGEDCGSLGLVVDWVGFLDQEKKVPAPSRLR